MLSRYLFRDRPREDLFRWRSPETSRIEGFSDAAFGFAITLLVVSEVPRTPAELLQTLRGFLGFAVTFGILFSLWKAQFTFFRRYGLEDETTINLTGVFLFLVMFSVYPLKFLIGGMAQVLVEGGADPFTAKQEVGWLFFAYGLGFASIFATLALMYGHAYRQRERLGLSPLEAFETASSVWRYAIQALASLLLLWLPMLLSLPYETRQRVGMPLFMAASLGVAFAGRLHRARIRRRRDALVAEHEAAA